MGRKARYSAEEKISAVQEYLDGKGSMKTIAQRLGIAFQSFKQWVKNYEAMGIDAFKTNHNKHYSKAEKRASSRSIFSWRRFSCGNLSKVQNSFDQSTQKLD